MADIQEKDIVLQKAVQRAYNEEIKKDKRWKKISCTKNLKLLSKKQINNRIFKSVRPLLKKINK
jgi:hypothetical protein